MSDPTAPPPNDFRADLEAVDRHTERFLATVRSLDPGLRRAAQPLRGLDPGHVLSHVARNADALLNLVTNATTGASTPMYASPESRDADIEAGARRPLAVQASDVEASAARFRAAADGLTDEVADVKLAARNNTSVRARFLPFMRLREVVFHHVDLDAGFAFADVEGDLALAFVEDQVRRLRANPETPSMTIRTDEGDAWSIGDGRPTVSGSRAARARPGSPAAQTTGLVGDLPTLPSEADVTRSETSGRRLLHRRRHERRAQRRPRAAPADHPQGQRVRRWTTTPTSSPAGPPAPSCSSTPPTTRPG